MDSHSSITWRLQWLMSRLDDDERQQLFDILRAKVRRCVVFLMILMLLSMWFGFEVGAGGCG